MCKIRYSFTATLTINYSTFALKDFEKSYVKIVLHETETKIVKVTAFCGKQGGGGDAEPSLSGIGLRKGSKTLNLFVTPNF